jgi:hypothetical protein
MQKNDSSSNGQKKGTVVQAVRIRATLLLRDTNGPQLKGLQLGILGSLIRNRTSMTFEALVSEDAQLVTFMDKSEPAWTMVNRGAKGGYFWDHNLKAFASFEGSDRPIARIKRSRGIQFRTRAEESRTIAEISLDDPTLGPIRHEVVFSDRLDVAPFRTALYRTLHCGPSCHKGSGLPYEELARLGFVTGQKTFLAESKIAFTELQIEILKVGDADISEFSPPSGFVAMEEVVKSVRVKESDTKDIDRLASLQLAKTIAVALADKGGYGSVARKPKEDFTPDCMGSTRFGSMAATVHPDFVDHAVSVINIVAPLLGKTTIDGGIWNIPWLASLASILAGSGNAPGSGIFCLLREPRVLSTSSGGPSGGTGLLDRLARRSLTERDDDGRTRTQREFKDGNLAATLVAWGISASTVAALTAFAGDMRPLTIDQQIEISRRVRNAGAWSGEYTRLADQARPLFIRFDFDRGYRLATAARC